MCCSHVAHVVRRCTFRFGRARYESVAVRGDSHEHDNVSVRVLCSLTVSARELISNTRPQTAAGFGWGGGRMGYQCVQLQQDTYKTHNMWQHIAPGKRRAKLSGTARIAPNRVYLFSATTHSRVVPLVRGRARRSRAGGCTMQAQGTTKAFKTLLHHTSILGNNLLVSSVGVSGRVPRRIHTEEHREEALRIIVTLHRVCKRVRAFMAYY